MQVRFDYRPLAIHRAFHASTAREKALFGAYGSGKTYALCAEAIALALEQPGSDILICRRTVAQVRDTTETVFMSILPTQLFNACQTRRDGGHYSRIIFPNGSNVRFKGIDDWAKERSLNVCAIFYDEADQFDAESVAGLESRIRQRDITAEARQRGYTNKITRRMTCFATNPAGRNWLWKRFVSRDREAGTAWFRSTSFDNPYLPFDYIERLLTWPEPMIRRFVLALGSDQPVLTPDGWRAIGTLTTRSRVIGSDGRSTRVRAVHPQGTRPLYRVTTSDGGSVLCDADHQWTVGRLDQSKTREAKIRWVTVPTHELRFDSKRGRRDLLPSVGPVDYGRDPKLPIDPYLLGLLLGDGSWNERHVSLAVTNPETKAAVRRIVGDRFQCPDGRRSAWIRDPDGDLRSELRSLGLMNARAPTKFVPEQYLRARPEDRLAVLQGLMDTDGHGGRTSNQYCTVSPELAKGVMELARSFGCRAARRVHPPSKGGNYEAHRVYISPPAGLELFRLSRKETFHSELGARRYVKSVEHVEDGDATCITVEAPDGLFVTKDYIVTHNCGFDDFGGQIYESWNWDDHVIEPPREGWGSSAVYWMGMDPGLRATAGLWVVRDDANARYVGVAEYQESNLAAKAHTDAWRALEARMRMTGKVKLRVADPAIATRDRSTGNRLEDAYRRLGFRFQHGAKFHKDRIPALGQLIHQRRFVVTKACPTTFDQIQAYRWEDITPMQRAKGFEPEDGAERPVKVNDHLVDCAQYLATRWSKPLEMRPPRIMVPDEDAFTREIYRTIKRNITARSSTMMEPGLII